LGLRGLADFLIGDALGKSSKKTSPSILLSNLTLFGVWFLFFEGVRIDFGAGESAAEPNSLFPGVCMIGVPTLSLVSSSSDNSLSIASRVVAIFFTVERGFVGVSSSRGCLFLPGVPLGVPLGVPFGVPLPRCFAGEPLDGDASKRGFSSLSQIVPRSAFNLIAGRTAGFGASLVPLEADGLAAPFGAV
jgi:hypothetical protein